MKQSILYLVVLSVVSTISGCASRIPLHGPETLLSLKGRKLHVKKKFFIIPLNNTRGTLAKYRDILANVESTEHFVISPGDVCTILDFNRLPEGSGSFVLMNISVFKNGENRIIEIEMHPDFKTPGKTLEEKTAFQLRDRTNLGWTLE